MNKTYFEEEHGEKKWLKNKKLDISIDIICLLLLVGITLYLIVFWDSFPDTIPVLNFNWGASEEAGKGALTALTVGAWLCYLTMAVPEYIMQSRNTSAKYTDETYARLKRLMKYYFATVRMLLVPYLVWVILYSSHAKAMPTLVAPLVMIPILGMTFFILYKVLTMDLKYKS